MTAQFGVRRNGDEAVERIPRRSDAESIARSFVSSPLRAGHRVATVVRRRGWDGPWETIVQFESPR